MDENKAVTSQNTAGPYFLIFLLFLALYVITCAPGSLWQDSGMMQYRAWNNDIEGGLGLALAHPLYYLIAIATKLIPFGDFAYKVNLISALCGAVTIANLFLVVRLWLGKLLPALVTAMTLGLSWTFWQHSVIAEVYTLYSAALSAELIFAYLFITTNRPRFLYLLGLFNGLSIANHMLGSLPFACYFIMIVIYLLKKKIKFHHVLILILAWLLGASAYLYLIIKQLIVTKDLAGTISSALWGTGFNSSVMNSSMTFRMVLENFGFIIYNFCTPNLLLMFVGLFVIYRLTKPKAFANLMLALCIIFFAFAFRYKVPDRYAFFLPFYCIAAIFFGLGSHYLFTKYNSKTLKITVLLLTLLPILAYWITPIQLQKANFNLGTTRTIPYRNDYTYFLRPWQNGNNGPELFAKEALQSVGKDSVILADGTTIYALWYAQQTKGLRKDVKIIGVHGDYISPIPDPTKETINDFLAKYELYVVSPVKGYCPQFLLDGFDFEKKGILYKVIAKETKKQ